MFQEERTCPYCNKTFVVNGFRYCIAKTLSCYFCGKRFKTNRVVIKIEGKTITPWICNKCSWHNSEIDEQCRNKICDNTKTKQTEQVNKK